ncbi:growth-regulating factor 2-like [Phoenix dactylifera]|uniref:Growth-regulating factor n=1 Tax=Phoenix dactylifera TaxID=42345 RepID=A0A8B9A7C0_PHODC|nr:growth-regulating factor 2-like [Phoenix dactylifera]
MGVGGCDLRGFPLTSAQRQEIQRQALIYKHIISSVPVPSDLLISNSPPYHLPPNLVAGRGGGGTFNLRFSNRMDPEPWRCRRTDGKKWRCSRNAAPDQKYCERHMHRGRPRSRKPVEVSNTKPTSTNAPPTTAVPTNSPTIVTTTTTTASLSRPLPSQSSGLFLKDELKIPFQSLEPNEEQRCLDWMKGNNEEMESSLQWELMHSKIGLTHGTIPVLQHYEDQLTLNYAAFLNPDLCSLEENAVGNRGEAPRSFIDAWSTETPAATAEVGNSTSVPTTGELPLSTLTLSMPSTGEGTNHQIQMAPVSPLGGPLGEVLQTSSATSPRQGFGANDGDSSSRGLINILSHGFHGSHEVSLQESPTRMASSPSGVLQKALVSLSDW